MISNLKIKASAIKALPLDQVFKKLEAGKTITGLNSGDRHQLRIEMETDIDTIKKVISYIQEIGKLG
jgi:hypothetical protein